VRTPTAHPALLRFHTPHPQVRLLVASAGLEVLRLKRVRVGGFVLPRSLPLGKFM
jgi:16S rRNA U516 pseudouridylate synthase RsuA-like enzyme